MKFLLAGAVGLVVGIVGYWVGRLLFPNQGDLGDISQSFMRLGLGLVAFVVGTVVAFALLRLGGH